MADFAEPYAARVIAIMLGIAEEEWRTIAAESATVGLAMGVRIREHLPRIEAALAALYDYADAVIAARRREPRDDLVTSLLKSQSRSQADEGGLTAAELRDALVLLIFGGFDTTRNQLGLAMQVFLEHPGQWRLLGERPELGTAAVEEVMRVRPTTTWVTREALADFTFDGLDIEAGTTIHLFCESAGTDPGQAGPGRQARGRRAEVRHHRDRAAAALRLRRGNSLLPRALRGAGRHGHGADRAGGQAAGSASRRGGKLASRQREHRPRSAPYCLYRRSAGQVSLR